MSAHAGRSGAVYLAIESVTGVATSCIKLSAWTLDRATDTFEVTAFGDTNKTYVQGLASRASGTTRKQSRLRARSRPRA